jgi:predicted dehydrogenase
VRDADVRGVCSPNSAHAEEAAELARTLRVGEARAFSSIEEMVASPDIDCIWMCGPNHMRIENMERIVDTLQSGKGQLIGIACEKPLARNVAEARRMVELVERAGVLHGYLEDQLFSPGITRGRSLIWSRGAALTGRPYLARAAEEHSGPHMPWFWQGELQGGGVLNDMMCHSVEVARYLLTEPGKPRDSIRPVKVSAQIASLKWSRPDYAKLLKEMMGSQVDYSNRPAEDFARATISYEDGEGNPLIAEVTTSWSYVGAGLRLSMELLGPEYSLSMNSLDSGLRLFFSRRVKGEAGEDLVEKQNAEQGLMPVVSNEASEYGYEGENRYFVQCFLDGKQPEENFYDGLEVTELLMTAYMSAEQERTIEFRPKDLDRFTPAVARGEWNPRAMKA